MRSLLAAGWAFIGLGIGAALALTVWYHPARGQVLVDVLRLFLSWPFVVAVLGLAFGRTFQKELAQFIKNIGQIKFPGGGEIRTNQLPPATEETTADVPAIAAETEAEITALQLHVEEVTARAANAEQQQEQIITYAAQVIDHKTKQTIYWWFRYLDLFFVQKTKLVLQSLAQHPTFTKDFYSESWKDVIPDPKERETIFMVLLHHQMVEPSGPLFRVTNSGEEFLRFIEGQGEYTAEKVAESAPAAG